MPDTGFYEEHPAAAGAGDTPLEREDAAPHHATEAWSPHAWYSGQFHLWLTSIGTIIAVAVITRANVPLSAHIYFWTSLLACGMGITVGYHRLFAHRAFETYRVVEWLLAALGSCAGQGSVLWWVANHREHHQFSDRPGDPHSPYVTKDGQPLGYWSGLWHAHQRWIGKDVLVYDPHYVRDLVDRPGLAWIDRHWFSIHLAGLFLPGAICYLTDGTLYAALAGIMWGGVYRFFLVAHLTFAVNSLAHRMGDQPYEVRDGSRNNWVVGVLSFGEGWHNNHHAFPNCAALGHNWRQIDMGWLFIRLLEALGLAWNVRRPPSEARAHRRNLKPVEAGEHLASGG